MQRAKKYLTYISKLIKYNEAYRELQKGKQSSCKRTDITQPHSSWFVSSFTV